MTRSILESVTSSLGHFAGLSKPTLSCERQAPGNFSGLRATVLWLFPLPEQEKSLKGCAGWHVFAFRFVSQGVMKEVFVVAAVTIHEQGVLCVQRGHSPYTYLAQKWEFPGGKIEAQETHEAAIRREMLEELDLAVEPRETVLSVIHEYPDFKIHLHALLCTCSSREIVLKEHLDYRWLGVSDLPLLDWAAADLPIVAQLLAMDFGHFS
jgi:8-oxo-dGTP diphosphatase